MIALGTPTTVLRIAENSGIGQARRVAQKLATDTGFHEVDAGRVALVATELGTNLLRHAGGGELHLRAIPGVGGSGVELIAVDRGPGFDATRCLRDGYSSAGTQGIGLGSIARQTQVFDLHADPRGAVVLARLYPRGVTDWRFGVSQHALHGEPVCGDSWALAADRHYLAAAVVDGLGHGRSAATAADAAVAAFMVQPFGEPAQALESMHRGMHGTRGGAAAVARFHRPTGALAFAGIGNIGGTLAGTERTQGLASHPGILGVRYRRGHAFDYPHAAGRLLLMHSDGLQSRWRLADYPGLLHRHPAVVTAVLHRDFTRGRDDVTVLALALEAPHG